MKKKFATVRQAEKFASKISRYGTFQWLQAAAEDGYTNSKNIFDLNNIRILPKQLSKILKPDLTSNFFGTNITSPLILSPMGHQTQFHKLGEIEVAKGINSVNTIGFFGTQSRMSLDDIRKNNKNAKKLPGRYFLLEIKIGYSNKSNQVNEINVKQLLSA